MNDFVEDYVMPAFAVVLFGGTAIAGLCGIAMIVKATLKALIGG